MAVSVIFVRAIVEEMVRRGWQTDDALTRLGLRGERLDDGERVFALEQMDRIIQAALALTGEPALGLAVGRILREHKLQLLGHLMTSSRTLRGALRVLDSHGRSTFAPGEWALHESGGHARFDFHYELAAGDGNRFMAEVLACLALRFAGRFAAFASSPLTRVCFAHAQPGYHELVQQTFNCPVEYGAGRTTLEFAAALLDVPQAHGDALVHAALREAAARRVGAVRQSRPLAEQMREVLYSEVDLCRAEPAVMARRFGMVPSTMRRRLTEDGTSFRSLINEARCRLARAELRRGCSAQEVADVLGFSELPSFYRAFRRWTGETPRSYQRRALGDGFVSEAEDVASATDGVVEVGADVSS